MKTEAKVIEVIAVTKGGTREYFTMQGIMIGRQVGGSTVNIEGKPVKKKKGGGVVRSLTPREAAMVKRKQDERDLTLEERIKHEKKYNT